MPIKVKPLTSLLAEKISDDTTEPRKEFIDRIEPRKAFWNRYVKMVNEGSTVITFYGAGGVGKTALIEQIKKEINHSDSLTRKECKFIHYDFSISTDLREVLKELKFQLTAYGCTFPLFDTGNYYYSLKIGQDNITPLKAKSMMENYPWLREVKQKLLTADSISEKANPAFNTLKNFFADDDVISKLPFVGVIPKCCLIADMLLGEWMERTKILDADHQEIRKQLNARREEKLPLALYEFLPTLFAQDVADWMKMTGNKLVVLLDNYESLISATALATEEQLKRDLWLRGDKGLIFRMPNTLWTIVGRNKLRWEGALADEMEQHFITALSPEFSNRFLERAGITDENLRGELVKLTEGYPIFLDLCVDVYNEYKRQHKIEPTIDEFGSKHEEVVGRIFRYLDAAGDDVAKDMLEFLCVLNVWTDKLAVDIGGQIFNFSRNTYRRVKNFSFIKTDSIKNDELDLKFFRFDKTIQSLLVACCDKNLIAEVKTAVNKYFPKKIFADENVPDMKKFLGLKLWANFLVRFVDDAQTLQKEYADKFRRHVADLISRAEFDTAEEILNVFTNKFETFGDADNVPYSYFEMEFGKLRQAQGKYQAAFLRMNSAYERRARLLGDEHPATLAAMSNLAVMLSKLGRHDEAANLQEKVLMWRKNFFGDEAPETLTAMNNLAMMLSDLKRHDEALKLQEKVLALRQKKFGDEHPDTIRAMNNLATLLSKRGRHLEALELQKKVLAWREQNFGENNLETIGAVYNLSVTLNALKYYGDALERSEQVLLLRQKNLGDEHPDTINALNNFAELLSDLGRYDEALTLQKKVLTLCKEILGDEHSKTVDAMSKVADSLSCLGRYDEALTLRKKILDLQQKTFGDENLNTIDAMYKLADSLSDLERHDEAFKLGEKVLTLCKKVLGDENPDIIKVMNNLAASLYFLKRHDEALTFREDIFERCKKIFGDEHRDTLAAMNNLAWTLEKLNRYDEALELRENALALSQKIFGKEHFATTKAVNKLANTLNLLGRHDEARKLIEREH